MSPILPDVEVAAGADVLQEDDEAPGASWVMKSIPCTPALMRASCSTGLLMTFFGADNEGGVLSNSLSGILSTDGVPRGAGLEALNDASADDRNWSPILTGTLTGTAA